MILRTVDHKRLAIVGAQNGGEIGMHVLTNGFVSKKGKPIFG